MASNIVTRRVTTVDKVLLTKAMTNKQIADVHRVTNKDTGEIWYSMGEYCKDRGMDPSKAWQALHKIGLAKKTVKHNMWTPTPHGDNFLARNPSEPTGSYGFNNESFDDFIDQIGDTFITVYNGIVNKDIEFIKKWPDSNRAIFTDVSLEKIEEALINGAYDAKDRHELVDTLIKKYL